MLKKIIIFTFSVFFISLTVVYAAELSSLDSFIKEALQNNPEISVLKNQYKAANARIWQAASLNDPMVELEYDKITPDRELSDKPMKTVGISQEIPFPTKLYLRAKIASKLARMAYEMYKAKEREVISNVKTTSSELFLIYKSIEIANENKSILEQFSKIATSRYSTNQGTQADALKAQVELARVDNELILLEQRRLTSQARLNVLLNRDPKEEINKPSAGKPVKLTQSLDEFYAMAKSNNPELKAYHYAQERGRAAYQLSLNEFLPDFQVKVKQMQRKDRLENDAWAAMVGVTIPLWFFQKQAFGVKEMKAELEGLKAEYKMKENAVLFDIRDAYARAEANKKLVELYETAFIPQAEQTTAAAKRGYESKEADFLTLLDSQRMLTEFKLQHYEAILQLRIALADLEKAVGIDVEFN